MSIKRFSMDPYIIAAGQPRSDYIDRARFNLHSHVVGRITVFTWLDLTSMLVFQGRQ